MPVPSELLFNYHGRSGSLVSVSIIMKYRLFSAFYLDISASC